MLDLGKYSYTKKEREDGIGWCSDNAQTPVKLYSDEEPVGSRTCQQPSQGTGI